MDDVGYLLTMQIGVQDRVKIRCLPVPVLSGPTSGATWAQDVKEWYVQVRRWAIGTADNFHYMPVYKKTPAACDAWPMWANPMSAQPIAVTTAHLRSLALSTPAFLSVCQVRESSQFAVRGCDHFLLGIFSLLWSQSRTAAQCGQQRSQRTLDSALSDRSDSLFSSSHTSAACFQIILCSGPIFSLNANFTTLICPDDDVDKWTHGPSLQWVRNLSIGGHSLTPSKVLFILGLAPYFFYACMFLLDSIWIRALLHMHEDISLPRNIMHWIMVGPSMIAYSFTQLHGYNVLAFKGKVGACIHQLAGKATLGTGVGLDGLTKKGGAGAGGQSKSLNDDMVNSAAVSTQIADEQFEVESEEQRVNGEVPQRILPPAEGYDA